MKERKNERVEWKKEVNTGTTVILPVSHDQIFHRDHFPFLPHSFLVRFHRSHSLSTHFSYRTFLGLCLVHQSISLLNLCLAVDTLRPLRHLRSPPVLLNRTMTIALIQPDLMSQTQRRPRSTRISKSMPHPENQGSSSFKGILATWHGLRQRKCEGSKDLEFGSLSFHARGLRSPYYSDPFRWAKYRLVSRSYPNLDHRT